MLLCECCIMCAVAGLRSRYLLMNCAACGLNQLHWVRHTPSGLHIDLNHVVFCFALPIFNVFEASLKTKVRDSAGDYNDILTFSYCNFLKWYAKSRDVSYSFRVGCLFVYMKLTFEMLSKYILQVPLIVISEKCVMYMLIMY